MKVRRLPFRDLTEAIGPVLYEHSRMTYSGTLEPRWDVIPGNPCSIISELTGINRRTLLRWTAKGIPEEQADRIACALGLHVSLIWPSWFSEHSSDALPHGHETVTA